MFVINDILSKHSILPVWLFQNWILILTLIVGNFIMSIYNNCCENAIDGLSGNEYIIWWIWDIIWWVYDIIWSSILPFPGSVESDTALPPKSCSSLTSNFLQRQGFKLSWKSTFAARGIQDENPDFSREWVSWANVIFRSENRALVFDSLSGFHERRTWQLD